MPNFNEMFPSRYLGASDLKGTQPVVTIEKVVIEAIGQSKEQKPVAFFKEQKKGMVLNKTNSKKIAELAASTDTDDWAGVQIKLYVAEVEFQGDTVEALRVRSPLTREVRQPVAVAPKSDDIPF